MEMIKVFQDAVRGTLRGEYSKGEKSESLRQALIELNGGSTKMPKHLSHDNKMFALVEELIPTIIEEGLKDEDEIFSLVDYKNIAEGDVNEFYTKDKNRFVVADAAKGIKGVRRQRLGDGDKITVNTSMKIIRIYENLGRLLAGRADFDEFVEAVATAFKQQILADAYAAISSISKDTAGLDDTYAIDGTYDEDTLIDLVDHVEAATGKKAVIYGTRKALRKITTAVVSDEAKSDLYNLGYYGKANGTPLVVLRQAHKNGSDEFVLDDDKLFVVAGDDKPVKMVNEGEGLLIEGDPYDNNDLTREYVYGQGYGTGVLCAEKMGVYTIE